MGRGKNLGRVSVLTPELQTLVCNNLMAGASIKDSCEAVGMTVWTYYLWMDIAECYETGVPHEREPKDPSIRAAWYEKHVNFAYEAKKARAAARLGSIARIRSDPSWQAAAWFLERSLPQEWGRHSFMHIEGLEPLLKLAKEKGIDASELFNSMIAALVEENESESVDR